MGSLKGSFPWTSVLIVCAAVLLPGLGFRSPLLWGQGTAYLSGYVLDPSHAAVANATVTVVNQNTGNSLVLKTTEAGVYRTPALEPGAYRLTVAARGFMTQVINNVDVQTGQPQGINVTLVVGTVGQNVEVSAAPPLLKTEDSGLGQTVEYHQVARLPYFSRSAGALLGLSPGVRYTGEDQISYGASRYNVGGYTNVNTLVDGARVNGDREDVAQMTLNPSVESLSEVKIITNQYSAEYGQDVGSLVMMQTKSGTNNFHGGAYEYLRNEALDTYNAFTRTRPVDREHMFGGALGGPIIKNKLVAFFSGEELLQTSPIAQVLTVPTAAEKQGNFNGITDRNGNPITLYDPATTSCSGGVCTRQPFAGNIIPSTRFDPVAQKMLKYFPDPTLPGFVNNLPVSTGVTSHLFRSVTRVDWNIGNNDTFSGIWNFVRDTTNNLGAAPYNAISPAVSPTLGGFGFQYQTQIFNFEETHLFSPTLFMSNRIVWRPRYISRLNPAVDPAAKYAENLGLKGWAGQFVPPPTGGDLGFPSFAFSGYTGLGPGFLLFQENPINEFDYYNSFSFMRGSHGIKIGFEVERGNHGAPDQGLPTGSYGFGPLETGMVAGGKGVPDTGDAFASFLLGQVDHASTDVGPLLIWHNWYFAPYVQDDWKVSPKLTLNLGLRWDVDLPVTVNNNQGNSFNLTAINPVSGTPGTYEFLGVNGYPTSFYNTDWHRFAPRLGFAYQIAPQTVIRGGLGIYNTSPVLGANERAPADGFTTSASFGSPDSGFSPTFILSQGFPAYPIGGNPALLNASFGSVAVGQTPVASPHYLDRNWDMGYAENFDLSIQRELSHDTVLEIATQGSLGRKLPFDYNLNEVPTQFWGQPGSNFARRPFPQFANVVNIKHAEGTTNYYSAYIRLDKHFSNGLSVIANYDIGKNIGFMGGSIYRPQLSHGYTVFDNANGTTGVPIHMATASFVYELPWGPGRAVLQHGVLGNVLGGWDIGGIFGAHSGVPFDVSSGIDSLNANSPLGGRANIIGNPIPANRTVNNWLNAAAFAAPTAGQVGNECCGMFTSPANFKIDASLEKSFDLGEARRIRLVGEFFNLTNTPQWGVPNTNIQSPAFGVIRGAGSGQGANVANGFDGARIIQLGLRFDF